MDNYFDHLFTHEAQNYPPYNVVKIDDDHSYLELALAGFKKDEVKVYTEKGNLVVEGSREGTDGREYVHRGLAQRNFTRSWSISEDTEVSDVTFENGLLVVKLDRVIPESRKRRYLLGGGDSK
jgi:molecular chaperone IbpA|tara:strand:- start:978 stop:1346 length:369 start_codon:yes stop_codon:yes gene_type:complete